MKDDRKTKNSNHCLKTLSDSGVILNSDLGVENYAN
tara:strand:- start:26 stop:133 length:108 start_codon:yes stop_codon:yes gene_type:complete